MSRASRTPDVAVIGCGRWGRNLARTLADLGALAAVSDADDATAATQAATHGVHPISAPELLSDSSIGAVAIAAPAPRHAELALAALAAGKDVFVEKPFATDLAAARRMASAAGDRVLMVGHLLQYHPAFEEMLRRVRSGAIGALRYATAVRSSFGRLRTEENALDSLAPHDISMLLAIFGAAPDRVEARGGDFVTPGVADAVWTHLGFASGGQASIFSSWLAPVKEQRLTVVGDRGMLVFDDLKPWAEKLQLRAYGVARGGEPELEGGQAVALALQEEEPLRRECAHFLACRASRAAPRTGPEEALAVQEVLDRAQTSMAAARGEPRLSPARSAEGFRSQAFA